jgi:hypothetical protein
MSTYSRADWGAAPARSGPGPLSALDVVGLVFHWPAMSKPIRGFAAVAAALRSWQAYHMGKGWSDIAYQEAYDQDGNVYILRGLDTQSAANGDADVNDDFGAVLLILAPGEEPSAKMVATIRRRVAEHRRLFPRSRALLGHNEVRAEGTACPGPLVQQHLVSGTFEPGLDPRALMRADLNAAMAPVKRALEKAVGRPRMRYQLERARVALSRARKINRGA